MSQSQSLQYPAGMCPERHRLLIEYRDTVHQYSERVRDWVETIGLEVNADLHLLRVRCAESWERAERARVSLSRHEAVHRCDRLAAPPPALG
jgi:hypothetical protein